MLLSEAFEAYATDVIAFRNQSHKTEEHHFVALKSLILSVGDIDIEHLTFNDVRDWKLSLEKRKLTPSTIRGYLVRVRVVLGYMQRRGVRCLDPAEIPLPKRTQSVPGVLSPEEVSLLISATKKPRNKLIIALLYSTGLRVAELCALDRSDVKNDYFPVIGKGGYKRLCFVDERSRSLLKDYLQQRTEGYDVYWQCRGQVTKRLRYHVTGDNNKALFINPQTNERITPSTVQEVFRLARIKAGFDWPVHPHSMRHSFATNLMVNGAPIYSVSKLLGHKRLDTTAQYLHLYDSHLEEIHKKYHSV